MKVNFQKLKNGQRLKLIKKLKGNEKQEFVGIVRQTEFGLICESDPSEGSAWYLLTPETIKEEWNEVDYF